MLEYPGAREEDIARLRTQWGLDRPFHVQYLKFAGNVFRGEFGNSFQHALPVRDIYFDRLPNSLQLAGAAFALSLLIGIPLGILSAVKIGTWWDGAGKLFALLGLSVPSFFVALLLILLFGLKLDLLPFFGKGTGFWGGKELILPTVSLGWFFSGAMLRITRSSVLEVLGSDYIKLARLKGLPEWVVVSKHAFKNALIPVMTLAAVNLVLMINVAVIVEGIFNWPGIGLMLFDGLTNRDFPVVQGVVLMAGAMIVGINLMVDILYAYIDPRIRLAR